MEALAKFESNGTFNFETFMKKRMNIIRKGSTVVIITPNLDKSTGAQGLLLKSKNLNPLFIVVTYNESSIGLIDATVEKGLSREAIPIYILDYETNIKAALEA